jgi:hypothetical protein
MSVSTSGKCFNPRHVARFSPPPRPQQATGTSAPVPVGFLVFMLSMGVALLRRRSRVKAVTEV